MSLPEKEDLSANPERRTFLKFMGTVAMGVALVGGLRGMVQTIIPQSSPLASGFPTMTLVDSSGNPIKTTDLQVNSASVVTFEYPLQGEPNFLLRLGDNSNRDVEVKSMTVKSPASGKTFQSPPGVGPYKSVVASSAICQHLGCEPPIIHFYPPSSGSYPGKIHCNCHGSTYDPYQGFGIVTGPTLDPLPNVVLGYDAYSDTYKVVNMAGPTIYGHTNDLSGGNPLPSSTQTKIQNTGTPTS